MAGIEPEEQLKELGSTLAGIEQVLDLDGMRRDIAELREQSFDHVASPRQHRQSRGDRLAAWLEAA